MDYSETLQNVIIALIVVLFISIYICLYNEYYQGILQLVCFTFFVIIFLLSILILNEQLQNINDEGSQNTSNIEIMNTYLETINPLLEMADEQGNPLYYPGINL